MGFSVPRTVTDSILASNSGFTIQTHKYSWAFIRALESAGGTVEILSVPQVLDYPKGKFYYSGKSFKEGNTSGRMLPFINILGLKHFTRFFISSYYAISQLKDKKHKVVITYGLHSPFLLSSIIAAFLFSKKLIVIITDPPALILASDGRIRRILKKIDQRITHSLLRFYDASIVLSEKIAHDYMRSKPFLLLEGIYNEEYSIDSSKCSIENEDKIIVTYAGSIDEFSGIEMLLDAFLEIGNERIEFNVCGDGNRSEYCAEKSNLHENIKFWGMLGSDDMARMIKSSDVMVNMRDPNLDFTKYSFPSKITEILGSGVTLLSSRLESIPNEYDDFIFFTDEYSKEGIVKVINKIVEVGKSDLKTIGSSAKEFIRRDKGIVCQGNKISNFIEEVISGRFQR